MITDHHQVDGHEDGDTAPLMSSGRSDTERMDEQEIACQRERGYEMDMRLFLKQGWQVEKDAMVYAAIFLLILYSLFLLAGLVPVINGVLIILLCPLYLGMFKVFHLHDQGLPISMSNFFYILSSKHLYIQGFLLIIVKYLLPILGFIFIYAIFTLQDDDRPSFWDYLILVILIIPGIYFYVSYMFAEVIFSRQEDDQLSFWDCMESSRKMTNINKWHGFWKTMLFGAALALINIAGLSLHFGVGLLITLPWTAFSLCSAWKHNQYV